MKNIKCFQQVIIIAIMFSLPFQNIYCQKDYRKGYIITNSNDTIHGAIEFKGDISSAKKCIFLKDGASEKVEYTANEIQAYRIDEGKFYISKTIKTEDIKEVLFLEYLIEGIVNVYYYRDEKKDHYYIERRGEDLLELKNETRVEYVGNVKYANESNEYKGVLKYVFQDSPKTSQEVDNLYLEHKSMIKIAKDYHNEVCSGEKCIVFEQKKSKIKIKLGPMIGINTYQINFPGYHCKSSLFPSFGLFLKLSMPSFTQRLFFQYEINYSERSLKGNYPSPIYDEISYKIKGYNYLKVSLDLGSIKNSGIFRYQFPVGKISPILQAGVFADYFLKSKYIDGPPNIENPSISNFDYGFIMGFGGTFKISKKNEINLDINYQMGKGVDQYSTIPEWNAPELTNRHTITSENHTRSLFINLSYGF